MQAVNRTEYHDAIVVGELTVQSTGGADGVHQFNRYISGLLHVAIDTDDQPQRDRLWRTQSLPLMGVTHENKGQQNDSGLR
jgi:hypothetical protein